MVDKTNINMKKILYALFTLILSSTSFSQTLMSDGDHRIMMNDYATNLNNVLSANCPQGITIDQFKKKIVNGELALSNTAKTSILDYATSLKTYGGNFATSKGLTATTDAYKYFYASFAPSTLVQNNKLVEGNPNIGLTGEDMWYCALENLNISDCGLNVFVGDKSNVNNFSNAAVTLLTNQIGDVGVLIMLNGLSECFYNYNNKYFQLINQNYSYLINKPEILQKLEDLAGTTIDPFADTLYLNEYGFSIDISDFSYLENRENYSYSFEIKNEDENQDTFKNLVLNTHNYVDYNAYILEYPETNNPETINQPSAIKELNNNAYTSRFVTGSCIDILIVSGCVFDPADGGPRQYLTHCDGLNHETIGNPGMGYGPGKQTPAILAIVDINYGCLSGTTPGPPVPAPSPVVSPSTPISGGPRGGASPIGDSHPIIKTKSQNPNLVNNFINPFIATPALPKITIPTEPCVQLSKLVDPNRGSGNIKSDVDALKQMVKSNQNNHEMGFETTQSLDSIGNLLYDSTLKTGGALSVSLGTGKNYIGGGHSHPSDGHPMFSFGDVKYLRDLYKDTQYQRVRKEVFYILVCKDKNTEETKTYAIKIDNFTALDDNVNEIWDVKYENIADEKSKLKAIHKKQAFKYNKCNGDYEKSFLEQFAAFGISLYEATNENLTNWDKLSLDENSEVKPTPCN